MVTGYGQPEKNNEPMATGGAPESTVAPCEKETKI
jgi:hypothetical protein